MFNLFRKPKPKTQEDLRAERKEQSRARAERARARRAQAVERIMQKLRAERPGWSDDKVRAFAAVKFGAEQRERDTRAQGTAEAELIAASNRLLVQCEASAESARAVLERPPLGRPAIPVRFGSSTELLTVTAFKQLQSDLAQRVISGGDDVDRAQLAYVNGIAEKHGLPEVYKQGEKAE